MKVYIKYDRAGEILSVAKVEMMPAHLEHPYAMMAEEEAVLELPAKEEYLQLDSLQFHEKYKVDVARKRLLKKT